MATQKQDPNMRNLKGKPGRQEQCTIPCIKVKGSKGGGHSPRKDRRYGAFRKGIINIQKASHPGKLPHDNEGDIRKKEARRNSDTIKPCFLIYTTLAMSTIMEVKRKPTFAANQENMVAPHPQTCTQKKKKQQIYQTKLFLVSIVAGKTIHLRYNREP